MTLHAGIAFLFLLISTFQAWATGTPTVDLAKRATSTPVSAGDAGTDDVPAIEAAIKSCCNGGVIIIPAGHPKHSVFRWLCELRLSN
ncbi:hypothetical protein B0H16DRAFT_1551204 [Mycena metata]|uniref:Pectate lyase superfamily protein domain-containing protein n=1 Tax=Mycena metata TaxID=1033252 RepID=A0AAD7N921_9AGAR|nr:hypothetical protein B0H16DRAFT_1551204 [Mycena metata]